MIHKDSDWKHPVAFMMNGIGDAVLALPSLRALAERLSGRLSLVTSRSSYKYLFDTLPLRQIVDTPHHRTSEGRSFNAAAIASQLGTPCDLLVSFNPWHSPSVDNLIKELRPKESIGFRDAFTVKLPYLCGEHAAIQNFAVVESICTVQPLGCFEYPIAFPEDATAAVQRLMSDLPDHTRLLVVHTETQQEKEWEAAKWDELLTGFLDNHPNFFCIVINRKRSNLTVCTSHERCVDCFNVSLRVAQCLVAHAALFCGIDSCMLHVADLCGVPSLGLFGPTDPREFGCRTPTNLNVRAGTTMLALTVAFVSQELNGIASRGQICV